jgi:hypothetical protein
MRAPELLESSFDMKNYGRNSKIVAAYTTLAVVAVGIIALDFANRSQLGGAIPDFPDHVLASQSPPTVPSASWNTAALTETGATLSNGKTNSATARRVTVAAYSALSPAK